MELDAVTETVLQLIPHIEGKCLRYKRLKQKHNARAAIITNAVQIKVVVSSPPPVSFINDTEAFRVSIIPFWLGIHSNSIHKRPTKKHFLAGLFFCSYDLFLIFTLWILAV